MWPEERGEEERGTAVSYLLQFYFKKLLTLFVTIYIKGGWRFCFKLGIFKSKIDKAIKG
jgi:hypothetical protein